MKGLTGLLFLLAFTGTVTAQYYYKDLILTKQTTEKRKTYKEAGIKSVKLNSFESNGRPTEGFNCEQAIAGDFSTITTYTRSNVSSASVLTAFYDNSGLLKKTIDTSDMYQSTTEYEYNGSGQIVTITNTALETDNQMKETEKHIWTYDSKGIPTGMTKIKGNSDTTYLQFTADEKGNIVEERPVRNNLKLPAVYYYYSDNNLLTDIVHYDAKAQRLLPDYVFEYDEHGRLITMLVVPKGSSDYQRWIYEYNEKGLKVKETCFNKRKELLGKIEYQYSNR
jgi:YD repeat-containing protein